MKNAVSNLPTEQFRQPPGITTVKINKSGRRAGACDKANDVDEEHYKSGTEPVLDFSQSRRCRKNLVKKEKKEETDPEL